jgi:hypothetical protein
VDEAVGEEEVFLVEVAFFRPLLRWVEVEVLVAEALAEEAEALVVSVAEVSAAAAQAAIGSAYILNNPDSELGFPFVKLIAYIF